MKNIYPSFTFVFVIFNLLFVWFKGKTYFNWWWIIIIFILEIIILAIIEIIISSKLQSDLTKK